MTAALDSLTRLRADMRDELSLNVSTAPIIWFFESCMGMARINTGSLCPREW